MKKRSLFFIAFVCIITLLSCSTNKKDKKTSNDVTSQSKSFENDEFSKLGIGNVLIDSVTTYKYKEIYERKIRKPTLGITNDKITQAVWFDRAAIEMLYKALEADKKLDGVRFHFISYDTLLTAPGQYKPHQTSIVVVPTNPNPTDPKKHLDNWNILKKQRLIQDSIFESLKLKSGLNHGELCPQKCK